MDNLRATRQPIGQGGGNKVEGMESDSLWEGEGTSDSLSSEAPTGPTTAVSKSARRMTGKQKASSVKSPGGLSGKPQGASVASAPAGNLLDLGVHSLMFFI